MHAHHDCVVIVVAIAIAITGPAMYVRTYVQLLPHAAGDFVIS